MLTLVYELVDQPEVEYEKEFSSRSESLLWLQGMRETDFQWLEACSPDGDIVACGWTDCLGVLNE